MQIFVVMNNPVFVRSGQCNVESIAIEIFLDDALQYEKYL